MGDFSIAFFACVFVCGVLGFSTVRRPFGIGGPRWGYWAQWGSLVATDVFISVAALHDAWTFASWGALALVMLFYAGLISLEVWLWRAMTRRLHRYGWETLQKRRIAQEKAKDLPRSIKAINREIDAAMRQLTAQVAELRSMHCTCDVAPELPGVAHRPGCPVRRFEIPSD